MSRDELAELEQLFQVMRRLRAPGGCPWDRSQTHETLMPYLLEETHEALEAIEEGSPEHLAEELGDLLVEVAMHTAMAEEAGEFDLALVARRAREKMVRRHPHVFADARVEGVEDLLRNWERMKREEKPERRSQLDGIPASLPALALASAVQRRRPRAAAAEGTPGVYGDPARVAGERLASLRASKGRPGTEQRRLLGELLFAVVALARELGLDAESALRQEARRERGRLRSWELGGGGPEPG